MDRLERTDSNVKPGVWVLIALLSLALTALVVLILTVQPGEEDTRTSSTTIQHTTTQGVSAACGPASVTATTARSDRGSDRAPNCSITCKSSAKEDESKRKVNLIKVKHIFEKVINQVPKYDDFPKIEEYTRDWMKTVEMFRYFCRRDTSNEELQGISMAKEFFRNASGWPMLEGDTSNTTWTIDKIWEIECLFKKLFLKGGGLIKMTLGLSDNRNYLIKIGKPDLRLPTAANDLLDYWMYKKNVAKLFGVKENVTEAEIRKVFKFEKALNELIQSSKHANTTKVKTFRELKNNISLSYFSWDKLLSFFKKYDSRKVRYEIEDLDYLTTLQNLTKRNNLRDVANFLFWRIAEELAPYISRAFRTNRPFGERENSIQDYCLEAVFRHTVPIIFSKGIKDLEQEKEVKEMTNNIRQEIINYICSVPPSSQKEKEIETINSITMHIGYPKDLMDNNKLRKYYDEFNEASNFVNTTTFLEAHIRLSKWNGEEMIKKNRMYAEWLNYDDLVTPTASYNEGQNYIAINIGLLKAPYFDISLSPEKKYGTLGYTIADLFMKSLGTEVHNEFPSSETVNVVFKALKRSELQANMTNSNRMTLKLKAVTSPSPRETTMELQTVATLNSQVKSGFKEGTTTQAAFPAPNKQEAQFIGNVTETMCKTHKESKVKETILKSIESLGIC